MRIVRAMGWAALLCALACATSVRAQDDFDFESLLDELDAEEAPATQDEQAAEEAEAAPEAEAAAQDEAEGGEPEGGMTDAADAEDAPADEAADGGEATADDEMDDLLGDMPGMEDEEAAEPAEPQEAAMDDEEQPAAADGPEPAMDEEAEADVAEPVEPEPAEAEWQEPADVQAAEADPAAQQEMEAPEEPPADADPAAQLSYREEVKRQAKEVKGLQSLEDGYQALSEDQYQKALEHFNEALKNIPKRPATEEDLRRVRWGRSEAEYQLARQAFDNEEYSDALNRVNNALQFVPDHRAAAKLKRRIERRQAKEPEPVPAGELPEIVDKRESVEDLIDQGRQFYSIGEYARAEAFFERVLQEDEYNTTAMRYLQKIADNKYEIESQSLETTRADMMQQVRETWNPPIRKEIDLPTDVTGRGAISTVTGSQKLMEKMNEIVIPSIEFRQANIQDVINFLVDASIAGDPEGVGVNIILNINTEGTGGGMGGGTGGGATDTRGGGQGGGFEDDFFGGDFEDEPEPQQDFGGGGGGGATGIPNITLNLRRVKLIDAIRYITEVANLKFRVEDNAVIITPANVVSGRVVTEVYPVLPSIVDVIIQREEQSTDDRSGGEFIEMGGRGTKFERGDVKDFFQGAGVPFPQGTSISYNSTISALIVANTRENLEIFERILGQLNVIPHQVEIEARFVEVSQNDLEELGLQWILSDDYEILTKQGPGGVASRERIQANADDEGITKGLRFFGLTDAGVTPQGQSALEAGETANLLGNILSFSSILTNPEVTMILHALDQSGNSDVLSAPRVTTRSGINAQIEVVEEIIYPTEFETSVTTISGGEGVSDRQVVTITPGSFETRETGVILNVTPTVGPDGYTIELIMAPEVAELIDWIDYGSQFEGVTYRILQPIFASRNVTTSIVIWDGQTVVMGGLIREELVTIQDKVPVLGDIPVLGRLFRNEGESSRKQNLLIFVTARVVDPAGKPVHKADALSLSAGGGAGAGQAGAGGGAE